MFNNCVNFNKPLDKWDVSNVTNMNYMFENCKKFNQCIDDWKLNSLKYCDNVMDGCDKYTFNKIYIPSILSTL